MGNRLSCHCTCLDSVFASLNSSQPDHVCEIYAHHNDLLTLMDGLSSLFTDGFKSDTMVYDKKVLLVIGNKRTFYMAWIPETPHAFEDYLKRQTMVAAVLKEIRPKEAKQEDDDSTEVVVVYESAKITPLDGNCI